MQVRVGDFVLVDPKDYYVGGKTWGKVSHIAFGSASVYPVKVAFPNGLGGQFKFSEIEALRNGGFHQTKDLVDFHLVTCERDERYWYARTNLDGVPVYTARMSSRAELIAEIGKLVEFYDLL